MPSIYCKGEAEGLSQEAVNHPGQKRLPRMCRCLKYLHEVCTDIHLCFSFFPFFFFPPSFFVQLLSPPSDRLHPSSEVKRRGNTLNSFIRCIRGTKIFVQEDRREAKCRSYWKHTAEGTGIIFAIPTLGLFFPPKTDI